ncbi:hypothetical protein RHRU231_110013 [Rhodococcus ruber]|uniref:Uncharacterized protein n=1 Tax=Rhodococcus ruber TaxID=1830 RepID=A0A098BDR5_9NOCA|nr:hypothetical protein RHRU231_110013 [Rhodococcus ruber]
MPSGKSHRGRSPRTGLYTQRTVVAPRVASHTRVALLAWTTRPTTVSSPSVSTVRRSGLPTGSGLLAEPGGGVEALGAQVPVGADADVAAADRFAAQRARGAAGGDDEFGAGGEVAGLLGGEEDADGVRALLGVVEDDGLVDLGLGDGEQFDDDVAAVGVPAQAHGPDAELRVDGGDERTDVDVRVLGQVGAEAAVHLLEEQAHAVGEDLHLLLLERDAHHPGGVHGLQIEHPVAGFTDGAGDEPVRGPEDMYRAGHRTSSLSYPSGVALPLSAAGGDLPAGRGRRLGGRCEPGQVRAGVVDPQHERAGLGVADDAEGRGLGDDALVAVEVRAERVGEDGLDDVAVGAGDPDDVTAVGGGEAAVVFADGGDGAGLDLREALAVGEHGGRGVLLDHLPQRFLQEFAEFAAGPLPVVHLDEAVVDEGGQAAVGGEGGHRLVAAQQRRVHDLGDGEAGEPRDEALGLDVADLVEFDAGGASGEDPGGVRRRAPVPQQDDRHEASLMGRAPDERARRGPGLRWPRWCRWRAGPGRGCRGRCGSRRTSTSSGRRRI